jgi:hypothetical protein
MVLVATTPPQGFPNRKSALPAAWRRLIELVQSTNFGRTAFSVKSGQPDFSQPVRTVRMVRLTGGDDSPRREAQSADFVLRKEVKSLLDQVAQARDRAVVTVKIEHGLPVHIEIEEEHQA